MLHPGSSRYVNNVIHIFYHGPGINKEQQVNMGGYRTGAFEFPGKPEMETPFTAVEKGKTKLQTQTFSINLNQNTYKL